MQRLNLARGAAEETYDYASGYEDEKHEEEVSRPPKREILCETKKSAPSRWAALKKAVDALDGRADVDEPAAQHVDHDDGMFVTSMPDWTYGSKNRSRKRPMKHFDSKRSPGRSPEAANPQKENEAQGTKRRLDEEHIPDINPHKRRLGITQAKREKRTEDGSELFTTATDDIVFEEEVMP